MMIQKKPKIAVVLDAHAVKRTMNGAFKRRCRECDDYKDPLGGKLIDKRWVCADCIKKENND